MWWMRVSGLTDVMVAGRLRWPCTLTPDDQEGGVAGGSRGRCVLRLNFAFAERRSEKQEVPQTPASQTCPDANPEKQKCIRSFLSQNAGGYRP